jgi:hypothetical protein
VLFSKISPRISQHKPREVNSTMVYQINYSYLNGGALRGKFVVLELMCAFV